MKKSNSLSTGKIAGLLGVSNKTIIKWISEGMLEAFQLPGGKHYRIIKKDLIRFLNNNNIPIPDEFVDVKRESRILIIDDDKNIVSSIKRLFINNDFIEWDAAYNGFDGGLKINTFKPDLVLLDFKMPGIDGIEVLKNIKSNPSTKHIKVIVISGYINKEIELKMKELGAAAVFNKPFKKDKLIAVINMILKLKNRKE